MKTIKQTTEKIVNLKVDYHDDIGYVVTIKGKLYKLIAIDSINNYNLIYSLPSNPIYPPWTAKLFKGSLHPNIVEKSWGRFKPKDKISVIVSAGSNTVITYKSINSNK